MCFFLFSLLDGYFGSWVFLLGFYLIFCGSILSRLFVSVDGEVV